MGQKRLQLQIILEINGKLLNDMSDSEFLQFVNYLRKKNSFELGEFFLKHLELYDLFNLTENCYKLVGRQIQLNKKKEEYDYQFLSLIERRMIHVFFLFETPQFDKFISKIWKVWISMYEKCYYENTSFSDAHFLLITNWTLKNQIYRKCYSNSNFETISEDMKNYFISLTFESLCNVILQERFLFFDIKEGINLDKKLFALTDYSATAIAGAKVWSMNAKIRKINIKDKEKILRHIDCLKRKKNDTDDLPIRLIKESHKNYWYPTKICLLPNVLFFLGWRPPKLLVLQNLFMNL